MPFQIAVASFRRRISVRSGECSLALKITVGSFRKKANKINGSSQNFVKALPDYRGFVSSRPLGRSGREIVGATGSSNPCGGAPAIGIGFVSWRRYSLPLGSFCSRPSHGSTMKPCGRQAGFSRSRPPIVGFPWSLYAGNLRGRSPGRFRGASLQGNSQGVGLLGGLGQNA